MRNNVHQKSKNMELHRGIQGWLLPVWFYRQNELLSPFFVPGETKFYNQTHRNWTEIRSNDGKTRLWVDRYGTIHLPDLCISLELWVDSGKFWVTPGQFQTAQSYIYQSKSVETNYKITGGHCQIAVWPLSDELQGGFGVEFGIQIENHEYIQPRALFWVVRPYYIDGIGKITRLEYKYNTLWANNRLIMSFPRDPNEFFFTHAQAGDVTQYRATNSKNWITQSKDGTCTGLVGYSGPDCELQHIQVTLLPSKTFHKVDNLFRGEIAKVSNTAIPDYFQTNTGLDEMFRCGMGHLNTFCPPAPQEIDQFQVLCLQRYGKLTVSKNYLLQSLKNIRWDGSLTERWIGATQLPFVVGDYYRFSGDQDMLRMIWPSLCKIGQFLQRVANELEGTGGYSKQIIFQGEYIEKLFWAAASLREMVFLTRLFGEMILTQVFQDGFLKFQKFFRLLLSNSNKSILSSGEVTLQENVGIWGALASYPLQYWPEGERTIRELLGGLSNRLRSGEKDRLGIKKGVDLSYMGRLGQAFIREGMNYDTVLNFLIKNATPTWSWPDIIHPLTHRGIGNCGHDPSTLYQVLLFLRNIFILEEGETLSLLPGVFMSRWWHWPQIRLQKVPTRFGEISLECRTVGRMIRIEYEAEYRTAPQQIIFRLRPGDKVINADAPYHIINGRLEITPEFRQIRLERIWS